ncbi:MAG: metallophosphoesterase [Thiolinea sp.]
MALQIVQISDTHISLDAPQRDEDLANCIQAINALPIQPDLVIHTGDIANRGSKEEYHIAQRLLNQLNVPYYVIPGNRDRRADLTNTLNDQCYQQTEQGWIQYAIEQYPVRIILVDTLNEQSHKGKLCAARLKHLETMLLVDTSKPVAIFLHHPPYEATGIPDPFQYDDWQDVENLSALLSQFNNICGIYCGHVHRFIDGTVGGIKASAISCLAGDLRKGEVDDADRKLPIYKVLTLPG